jgi:hypothetical protein
MIYGKKKYKKNVEKGQIGGFPSHENCTWGSIMSQKKQKSKGCGPDPHQFSGSSSRDVSQTTYLRCTATSKKHQKMMVI